LEQNSTLALRNISKINECLKAVEVLGITDIFLTKSEILIGKFSHPFLCVCCKNVKEKFYSFWKLTVLFLHTKILEIFDRTVSPESISQFCPVSEFGYSTKIRVF
jgi:hypothetical protein